MSHDWDPFDPDALKDPSAVHARLRAQCPVAHTGRAGGYWALFKYDDIVTATRNPHTFSSALTSPTPSRRQIPLESDPPEHTAYRRFLQTYFSADRLASLEPTIRRIVTTLIDPLLQRGSGDFTPEVGYPLPARTLCAFLNQPDADWLEIKRMADNLFRTDSRFSGTGDGQAALEAVYAYARSIVSARTAAPRDREDDLASGLLCAEIGGQRLDDDTVVGILRLILTAGHNSTTSALGIVALYLATHPEVQSRLRAHPDEIAESIEEILRWQSPVQFLPRVLTRDVDIRGRRLRAGEQVALVWTSGNRDEEAFDRADECILDRDARRNLVFGYGIHKCVGAPLARLELRIMFDELLGRTTDFHVDGDVVRSHWPRYGVTTLPLRLCSSH
ncbi:MAG: cytochrome P450 [Chloroflexota bacterium]